LSQLLEDTGFAHYAAYKADKVPAFAGYDTFLAVLRSFEKLHCYGYCRKGPRSEAGCAKSCRIRACAEEKGFAGCWECGERDSCPQIAKMAEFHPGIRHNLRMIREHGADGWSESRGRHYRWSE